MAEPHDTKYACVWYITRLPSPSWLTVIITEEWVNKEIKLTSYKFDANSVKRSINKLLPFLHRDPALMEKLDVRKIKKPKQNEIRIQVQKFSK